MQPILGFSTEGAFHSENIPENLHFLLREYDKEIQAIIESPATNSTSDVLHIETTEKLNGASLSLYDINGRLLLSDKIK